MPVHLLVADVLLAIFWFAVKEDGGISKCGYLALNMREDMRRRLTISHVCQHWRELVQYSPSFWAVLDPHTRLGSELFLPRAGALPLTVNMMIPADRSARRQIALADHRICNLALSIPNDKPISFYLKKGARRVPPFDVSGLRCLAMSSPRGGGIWDKLEWHRGPEKFRALPHLKTLVAIRQCWTPTSVPHLTSLHIQGCILDATTLLPFLSGCPLLENLVFSDVVDRTATPAPQIARVALPRLRLLVLGWRLHPCHHHIASGTCTFQHVRNIDVPETCLVRVVTTRRATAPHTFPPLDVDAVSVILSHARLTLCTSNARRPGTGLLYMDDCREPFAPGAAASMLEALLGALPAEKIERATLTLARGWERGALARCLALLPAARALTIQHTLRGGPCPPWSAEELGAIVDVLADPAVCPRLEELAFSSPDGGVAEKLDVARIAAAGRPHRRVSVYHVDAAGNGGGVDAAPASGGECVVARVVLARHPVEPLTPGVMWKESMTEW